MKACSRNTIFYERAGYEKELEPLCRKEQIGVIGYYGLASGFLTGKYRSEADFKRARAAKTSASTSTNAASGS